MADRLHRKLAPILALLALGACNGRPPQADAKICTPFKAATPAGTTTEVAPGLPADARSDFEECLHRWGYRLARSDDGAEIVAKAVVGICGETLSQWNSQSLNQSGPGAPQATLDLHTGRSTTMLEQRYEYAQEKALFYVVQGRAGNCAAP